MEEKSVMILGMAGAMTEDVKGLWDVSRWFQEGVGKEYARYNAHEEQTKDVDCFLPRSKVPRIRSIGLRFPVDYGRV